MDKTTVNNSFRLNSRLFPGMFRVMLDWLLYYHQFTIILQGIGDAFFFVSEKINSGSINGTACLSAYCVNRANKALATATANSFVSANREQKNVCKHLIYGDFVKCWWIDTISIRFVYTDMRSPNHFSVGDFESLCYLYSNVLFSLITMEFPFAFARESLIYCEA